MRIGRKEMEISNEQRRCDRAVQRGDDMKIVGNCWAVLYVQLKFIKLH